MVARDCRMTSWATYESGGLTQWRVIMGVA
jgi:hypothetical protein